MRLSRKEIEEIYPMQSIGLNNVRYENDDGITVESGEVVFTGMSMDELLEMQVESNGQIIAFCTGGDSGLDSGVVEIDDEQIGISA